PNPPLLLRPARYCAARACPNNHDGDRAVYEATLAGSGLTQQHWSVGDGRIGTEHAELVTFWIRQDDEALNARLADIGTCRTESDETFDFVGRLVGFQIGMAAILSA